jgi:DNA-directed RNA polymerase specialized sigma24 family protein
LEEFSAEEIAKGLGIGKKSVYSEKSALRKKIQRMIEGD